MSLRKRGSSTSCRDSAHLGATFPTRGCSDAISSVHKRRRARWGLPRTGAMSCSGVSCVEGIVPLGLSVYEFVTSGSLLPVQAPAQPLPDLMDTQPGPMSQALSWRMSTTACFAAAQLLFGPRDKTQRGFSRNRRFDFQDAMKRGFFSHRF